jgi:ketosteroid isomerase-like protein
MSQENVEIVRRLFDAVARRDAATVLALYDPEVEWDSSRSPLTRVVGKSQRVFHGHEGLRHFFRERKEAWETAEDDCEELIDAGDDVISVVTSRARGRTSGIKVEASMAGVWTIRDSKVIRVVWFETREEAFEAGAESARFAGVNGLTAGDVVGVVLEQRVGDLHQLAYPPVGQAIDHRAILAPGVHKAAPAQAAQMSRHRGLRHLQAPHQLAGRQLAGFPKHPQDPQASRIAEATEVLGQQLGAARGIGQCEGGLRDHICARCHIGSHFG